MRKNDVTWMCGWFLFVAAIFYSTANASAIVADPVNLGWNPASDPTVKGYIIYYGLANQPTTNRIVVGTNLTVTLNNLQADVAHKIHATSYNAAGIESPPSNQVLLTPSVIPRLKLSRQPNNSMKLEYKVSPGAVCTVQFSADMKPGSWRTLTNVTADLVGGIIATDSSAAQVMKRFYRVALSPQPLLSPISVLRRPDSQIQLSFTAPPGTRYEIEYAPTATSTNWKYLAYATADAEGNVTLIDPAAPSVTSRFYRATLR